MLESILSLVLSASLLLGSPGPAPLALAATGAAYGIPSGLRFLVGILSGLVAAMIGAAMGLHALFLAFPTVASFVQIIGACYIVYIAYKIASAPVLSGELIDRNNAPGFRQGFLLNLLNPKAYAAFFALFSQFLLPFESTASSYLFTGLVCFFVAVVVDVIWLCLGGVIRPLFTRPKQARILRITFALMLLASVAWAFISLAFLSNKAV